MSRRNLQDFSAIAVELIERHWKWVVVLVWLGFATYFIAERWTAIHAFALGDTDDNMRIMQVRALLHGQGWYDLRQYRLDPPWGANIHWSRLVDLPIAALILGLKPFLGGAAAERWAVAIAPMLPYLLVLFSIALTVRRLVGPRAYPLAFLPLFWAGSTNGMFMPERIDHHGWQLAFLALGVACAADPRRTRGGLLLGLATALSLAIGLEMLIYLAILGTAIVLFWIVDRAEAERLRAYAVALSGGTALSFLIFASNANRAAVCDALSPVWLSDALLGGALLFLLARLSPQSWTARLGLAAAAGLAIAGFHAFLFPHCLRRLEGVSPEVEQLWLSHVREARPVYRHGWRTASSIVAIPITGTIGWLVLAWLKRHDRDHLRRIAAAAAPALVAALLLLWQTRTGPAAQMLGSIGAAALVWLLFPKVWGSKLAPLAVAGTALLVVAGAGAALPFTLKFFPDDKPTARDVAIRRANFLCNSMWGLWPVARQPKGMVFTFIDLGPRLIAVTPHDAVGGPYHRNGEQIADVMNAFRGSSDQAHRIIGKYRSDYLLTCPNSSTTTIFRAETPKGFYAQLAVGKVPNWLQPVDLGADSPFKMWRVVG
ncbi:MAG TPA: AcrB/AcrD/AcrF family protein [Sphingomicrobium sp.]|nr:AcrB/AcrD/AcrF family protein [Sphingomicrobium sp.]